MATSAVFPFPRRIPDPVHAGVLMFTAPLSIHSYLIMCRVYHFSTVMSMHFLYYFPLFPARSLLFQAITTVNAVHNSATATDTASRQ